MTKKIFTFMLTLCLVFTLAFATDTTVSAANHAGAYKANYSFNVYLNAFDAASGNGEMAWPTNVNGYTFAITIPAGRVYTAKADGVLRNESV